MIAKGLVIARGGAVVWLNYAYAGVVCWNLLALVAAYSSNIFSHCATRVYLATY